jgi:hypothetical protein
MAETQPMMLQALCYTATDFRNQMASLVCSEGVSDVVGGSRLVTTGGSGLDLSIAEGGAFIDSDVDDEGMYWAFNDAPETVTATAADGSNPRIDQVIVTISDSQLSGVDNEAVPSVLAGTPTVGATLTNLTGAAALPDRAIRLAYVLVPTSFAGPFVNATHILDAREPFGRCGSLVDTVSGPAAQTDFSAEATAVTLVAQLRSTRRYRITGYVLGTQQTGNGAPAVKIKQDAADFTNPAYLGTLNSGLVVLAAASFASSGGSYEFTTTTGQHTYTLRISDSANSFRVQADDRSMTDGFRSR